MWLGGPGSGPGEDNCDKGDGSTSTYPLEMLTGEWHVFFAIFS